MSDSIVKAYDRAAARGELQSDPAQHALAARLDRLAAELAQYEPSGGLLGMLRPKVRPPRGVYIQGDVGRGKTLLIDMFFEDVDQLLEIRDRHMPPLVTPDPPAVVA